ncbi:MAG: hypothetical protein V3U32_06665 [Anaerolineales bacterium]
MADELAKPARGMTPSLRFHNPHPVPEGAPYIPVLEPFNIMMWLVTGCK